MKKGQTRGIRNNNPLNIIHGKSRWQGMREKQTDKRFVQFETMVYGVRAAVKLLRNYIKHGIKTVDAIIYKWCPDHTAKAYTRTVVSRMASELPDFDPTKPISWFDRNTMYQLVKALCFVESVYDLPREEFDQACYMLDHRN